jgi:hypothetical protein
MCLVLSAPRKHRHLYESYVSIFYIILSTVV